MDPIADCASSAPAAQGSIQAIRLAVNIAQSDCVCRLHLCMCVLTDAGDRAGIQPFLYEQGEPA
jgi:hypothetical protein